MGSCVEAVALVQLVADIIEGAEPLVVVGADRRCRGRAGRGPAC
jgi:hypothetical protein